MNGEDGGLDDLLVVELSSVLAGPSVGQFFAELGARVVKVEHPRGGDITRSWLAPGQDPGSHSAYFASCNFGKESVALDLKDKTALAVLLRLIDKADIVTMSFKPGSAERLGLGADVLRKRNPRLIVGRVSGYGADNPRPGYDAVIQAEGGFMSINGTPDSGPVKMPVPLIDVLAAHQLKEGLLVALLRRSATGEGTVIDVSLIDSAISSLVNQATNYLMTGNVPKALGSAHPNIAPYGTVYYALGDEPLVLAVGTEPQFRALCDILGLQDLPADPRFENNAARVANRPALQDILQAAIGRLDRGEFLAELDRRVIPSGAVRSLDAVLGSGDGPMILGSAGEAEKTDAASSADDAALPGRVLGLRQVAFRSHGASRRLKPPPRVGEHTTIVLGDLAGATEEELAEICGDHR